MPAARVHSARYNICTPILTWRRMCRASAASDKRRRDDDDAYQPQPSRAVISVPCSCQPCSWSWILQGRDRVAVAPRATLCRIAQARNGGRSSSAKVCPTQPLRRSPCIAVVDQNTFSFGRAESFRYFKLTPAPPPRPPCKCLTVVLVHVGANCDQAITLSSSDEEEEVGPPFIFDLKDSKLFFGECGTPVHSAVANRCNLRVLRVLRQGARSAQLAQAR
jgi:hypothetical protein